LPIAEHGLIRDLHTDALVGTDGTIDWYCCPPFDSPNVFAALLDSCVPERRASLPSAFDTWAALQGPLPADDPFSLANLPAGTHVVLAPSARREVATASNSRKGPSAASLNALPRHLQPEQRATHKVPGANRPKKRR
jgi:hypothetical protein